MVGRTIFRLTGPARCRSGRPPGTVWKVPAGGGEETRVGDFTVNGRRYLNFAVGAQGIYYASSPDPAHWFELWLYRFSTG